MTERGDVLRLKSRMGFLPKGETGSVVVIQAGHLNAALPTAIVVPLDVATMLYTHQPTAVRVSAREAGSHADQVALTTQVRTLRFDHLAPGTVGRLTPSTLERLDSALRLVMGGL